jgi:hypothetical protein
LSDGYFFDKNKKLFMPCYKDCLSCNNYGNATKMNCLSCDDDIYDFYKKSSNCLNCPKFVDYSQEKCINEVPEGYFVENAVLGTIEKCHDLCKTCDKKSTVENGKIYMNCKTCKYTNSKYQLKIEGNCPDTQGEKDEDAKINEEGGGSNVLILVTVISSIVLILVIVSVILFIKCKSKTKDKENIDENDSDKDYFKMKGKNISLEDEPIN